MQTAQYNSGGEGEVISQRKSEIKHCDYGNIIITCHQ